MLNICHKFITDLLVLFFTTFHLFSKKTTTLHRLNKIILLKKGLPNKLIGRHKIASKSNDLFLSSYLQNQRPSYKAICIIYFQLIPLKVVPKNYHRNYPPYPGSCSKHIYLWISCHFGSGDNFVLFRLLSRLFREI